MEWERKFFDIVRETESNLANARRKLLGNGTISGTSSDYESPSRQSTSFVEPSASTSYVNHKDHINSVRQQMSTSCVNNSDHSNRQQLSTSYANNSNRHQMSLPYMNNTDHSNRHQLSTSYVNKINTSQMSSPCVNNTDHSNGHLSTSYVNNSDHSNRQPTTYVNNTGHVNSVRQQTAWSLSPSPQPGPVANSSFAALQSSVDMMQLQTKIDSQKMMIEKLEKLVKTLHQEKDQYCRQIRDLQDEVRDISSRLKDTRRHDPQPETHGSRTHSEVHSESDMQRLQNTLAATKASSCHSEDLERSFKDMQRSVHAELEGLRRQFSSMTQRVGRLELDVSTHSPQTTDPRDRSNVTHLSAPATSCHGHSSSFLGNQSSHMTPANAFQVKELRSTVSGLHDKLDNLEGRVAASLKSPLLHSAVLVDSSFRKSPPPSHKHTTSVTLDDFPDDDDDDNSDLDDLDQSDDLDLDVTPEVIMNFSNKLDKLEKVRWTKAPRKKKAVDFDVPSDDDLDLEDDLDDILRVDGPSKARRNPSTSKPSLRSQEKNRGKSRGFDDQLPSTSYLAASEDALLDLDLDSAADAVEPDSLNEDSDDLDLELDDLFGGSP